MLKAAKKRTSCRKDGKSFKCAGGSSGSQEEFMPEHGNRTRQQTLLVLLDRAGEQRSFYQTVLDQNGQAGLEEMIPLEEVLEAVQAYYRGRCGAPPNQAEEERGVWDRTL